MQFLRVCSKAHLCEGMLCPSLQSREMVGFLQLNLFWLRVMHHGQQSLQRGNLHGTTGIFLTSQRQWNQVLVWLGIFWVVSVMNNSGKTNPAQRFPQHPADSAVGCARRVSTLEICFDRKFLFFGHAHGTYTQIQSYVLSSYQVHWPKVKSHFNRLLHILSSRRLTDVSRVAANVEREALSATFYSWCPHITGNWSRVISGGSLADVLRSRIQIASFWSQT